MDRMFDLGASYVLQNHSVSRGCLVDGPSLFRIAAEILRYDFADF